VTPGMEIEQRRLFLATALATSGQRRVAIIIAGIAAVLFFIAAPFAQVPLARMPAFIPSYEAALVFIDVVTAVLLYEQFARLRLPGILVLASAYLFEALLIIPHALTFPGAFSETGLLGAKTQTTAWLYTFWHSGFSLFVIAYALLRRRDKNPISDSRVALPIAVSILCVALLATALVLMVTWGHDYLPVMIQGTSYSQAIYKGVNPTTWLLNFAAMLMLWQRRQRVVDLWLMLVMWIWLFDIALAAILGAARFDFGFYAGRIFGLVASSFLLIMLVIELGAMYAGALGAVHSAEQKLARLRSSQSAIPPRNEHTKLFIRRQNIAHYRQLLDSGTLDPAQRRAIEKLLSEEEQQSGSTPAA